MLLRLRHGYRVPKPRIMTKNDWNLVRYRKLLTDTFRRIRQESHEYQDRTENMFLEERKEKMLQQHRQNEKQYRTQIVCNGHILSEDLKRWKKEDQRRDLLLDQHLHKEQLKKINRDRILKILKYESENFWFNQENMEERLIETTIFPEEVGSTEYYYRLTEQALAYDEMNFEKLEELDNDEKTTRFKNRYLVPLFSQVVTILKQVKENPYRQNEKSYETEVKSINSLYSGDIYRQEREEKLKNAKQKYEKKKKNLIEAMNDQKNRDEFIKDKVKKIRNLLAYWKKYTKILNMTTGQISLMDLDRVHVGGMKVDLSNFIKTNATTELKKDTVYESTREKLTEDDQIDLEQFVGEKPLQKKADTMKISRLDSLLQTVEVEDRDLPQPRRYPDSVGISTEELKEVMNQPLMDIQVEEKDRFKDNTGVMIETWREMTEDKELKKLLEEVGQVSIEQAKLFWKIWEMH